MRPTSMKEIVLRDFLIRFFFSSKTSQQTWLKAVLMKTKDKKCCANIALKTFFVQPAADMHKTCISWEEKQTGFCIECEQPVPSPSLPSRKKRM
jgi:hypothetical protein